MLQLSRWDDHKGSSRGFWLVREISGMIIFRFGKSWRLGALEADIFMDLLTGGAARQAWGDNFSSLPALRLLELNPSLKQDFATRAQALIALQSTLAASTSSSLCDALIN